MKLRLIFAVILSIALLAVTTEAADPGAEITPSMIENFQKATSEATGIDRVINAATNNSLKQLSLNRSIITHYDPLFNFKLKGSKIIDQKNSGRCWMFAGVNTVTPHILTKLKLSDLKLSEAYLAFWDKLEKCNSFLETMIDLRDKDRKDRSLQMYLEEPIGDGGWWHYFSDLIDKYGLVPSTAMPETQQSSSTTALNNLLNTILRKATAEIRTRAADGQSVKKLREYKKEVLGDVYKVLVCAYGRPPKEFTFRWETGEDSAKVINEKEFTPMSFYHEFYGESMPEYVAICNNPTLAYDTPYKLEGGRNITETADLLVLNLPIEKLKAYAYKALLDSEVVWFACDVGKDNFNDSGIFAVDVYDYNATLGIDANMSKADRIAYHDISPNHAMALIGVDTTADGVPRKWKVENSWGTKHGKEGYWTMYDSWFDQYVLMVVVEKSKLGPGDLASYQKKPVVVADWEPFFVALRNLQ